MDAVILKKADPIDTHQASRRGGTTRDRGNRSIAKPDNR